MSTITHSTPSSRTVVIVLDRLIYQVSRHWILVFSLVVGCYVGLPWLAPVLMHLGWVDAGNAIYLLYSTQCHQMPQRSFFVFGPQGMYSLALIQAAWKPTADPMMLRQFVGNVQMGWKVAWSDRMVSMYSSLLPFAWLWSKLRPRIRPLAWWGFVLSLLPMALDGGTHLVSDVLGGIGGGFRDTNAWLAVLTHNALPVSFYVGDSLGSFNSWMRLLTGVFFAFGVVWFGFPYLQAAFDDLARNLEDKFQRAGLRL